MDRVLLVRAGVSGSLEMGLGSLGPGFVGSAHVWGFFQVGCLLLCWSASGWGALLVSPTLAALGQEHLVYKITEFRANTHTGSFINSAYDQICA